VGMWAADETHTHRTGGHRDIVKKTAGATQQTIIFLPKECRPDALVVCLIGFHLSPLP
jgi:hypothetical protein